MKAFHLLIHITRLCVLAILLTVGTGQDLFAQEPDDEPIVETLIDTLNHPCGIAIHSGTGAIYLSDSGHGKVIRVVNGTTEDVITGYPLESVEGDFKFRAGPLGISFLNEKQLVVGSGCWGPGLDRVSIFDLIDSPQNCDDETFSRSIGSTADDPALEDFFGVASDGNRSFITSRGDPDAGWVNQLILKKGNKLEFKRFIDTRSATGTGLPTAITISPDGFVVVGQRSQNGIESVLAFYDQTEGDVRAKFDMHQNGIVALAYGPNKKRLFALFNSNSDPDQNGLYKLVGRRRNTACETELIRSIPYPLAMAFSEDGSLYVTAGKDDGVLIRIRGLDNPSTPDSSQSD